MNIKPQPYINKRSNLIIGLSTFAFALLIYYLTMARTLSFWDAGEYITCSSILGIPHPPGNPFYILLGRFFTIIGGNIPDAIVVNFLSGLFSAFAVMFTYFFTVKIVTMLQKDNSEAYLSYISGFIAAMFTAFSFTFWHNAIEAEVYSGLAFGINLIVWLTLIWVEKSDGLSHLNILLLIVYIFFLTFGIHQTSLQIAPAVLFIVVYPLLLDNIKSSAFWKRAIIYMVCLLLIYGIFLQIGESVHIPSLSKYLVLTGILAILVYHFRHDISLKVWLLALLMICIGLSTHIFLLVRSAHRPFINEGHPHNLSLFTDYVLRRQYGVVSMFERRASIIYQMKDQFLTYFSWQFFNAETLSKFLRIPQAFIQFISNLIVTFLGFGGAYFMFRKNKHAFAYFFALMFWTSIAMVFVMNLSDAEVRDRDYFFTTAYNFWAVWMGVGAAYLIYLIRKKIKYLTIPIAFVLLLLPIINLASQYFIHDRSREYIALDYGLNILNSVDENAIIFTNGDNDTFPVWYAQAVYDPAAFEFVHPTKNQISTEEYELLSDSAKASLAVTEANIKKAMTYKEEQCKGVRKDISIANLSLLNTPWYIYQLIDKEGVEFNVPNWHIDNCQLDPKSVLYPKQVPRDTNLTIKGVLPGDEFTITFPKGTILYVKDLAVIQIIKDNYGKRPIYFAVTTPEAIGFGDHLQNEGMVDRLVRSKGKYLIDMERIKTNIDSVYSYRSISDESVYKDSNMRRLLNNYAAAFMRISQSAHRKRDYSSAINYMERAIEFIDDKTRFYAGLSQLYLEAGFFLIEKGDSEEGFIFLENAVYYNRYDDELLTAIFQATIYSEQYDKGIELLNKIRTYQDAQLVDSFISRIQSRQK